MKKIDLSKVKKVLIIRPRAIGDVVLTTPFIRALRKALPQAQIDYVVEPFASKALEGNPHLNNIYVFDRHKMKKEPANIRAIKKNTLKKTGPFAKMVNNIIFYIKLRAQRYDLTFDLWGNLRTALMSFLTGARYRVGFTFRGRKYFYNYRVEPDPQAKYNAWYHMDLLKAAGIPDDGQQTEFYLDAAAEKFASEFYEQAGVKPWEKVIGLNGAGSWATKRWPEKKLSAVCAMILEKIPGSRVLVLWGPGEKEMAQAIIDGATSQKGRVLLAPQTDLKQLGAVLKRLDGLVTNDGGPGHIAVALGVPSVTVFGPTNYKSWAPAGDPLHSVVFSKVACAPCDKMECPEKGIICMESVSETEVFAALQDLLNRAADKKIKNKTC